VIKVVGEISAELSPNYSKRVLSVLSAILKNFISKEIEN